MLKSIGTLFRGWESDSLDEKSLDETGNRVVPLNNDQWDIRIIGVSSKDNIERIVDEVKKGVMIMMNIHELNDPDELSYVLTYIKGAMYAICGTFSQVSRYAYMAAPEQANVIYEIEAFCI